MHGKRDACVPGTKERKEPGRMHRDVTAMVLYEQGISPQRCDEATGIKGNYKLGMCPGMATAKKLITEYYMGK